MLDDPKYIAQFDPNNGLAMVGGQPAQLQQKFEVIVPKSRINQVVVAAMGGSALGSELIKGWLSDRLSVPYEIVRDYSLPQYVGPETLVIASSYSGNTEETLSALKEAKQRNAVICTIAAGGEMASVNQTKTHLSLVSGLQPRLTPFFGAKAIATILEGAGIIEGATSELEAAGAWLEHQALAFMANAPEAENPAKQIAKQLAGHPVVIYGGQTLAMPAMKWKIDVNENAKSLAFYNRLPEFNHNEFNGWVLSKQSPFRVVQLHSNLDNGRISKRFEVTNRLLSGHMPTPIIVKAVGETKLQQMLWTILLGDYVSLYLAFLNQIDPVPVDMIEKLKVELNK